MVITTHESHAAALLAGGDKLAGSARYAEAIGGLPPGQPADDVPRRRRPDRRPRPGGGGSGRRWPRCRRVAMSVGMDGDVGRTAIYARIDY